MIKMAYTPKFSTKNAIYRLFHTNHNRVTKEDIINSDRISKLDGIVLEVTGDKIIRNPPETVLWMYDHGGVVEIVKSLGEKGPSIYVVDVHMNNMLIDSLLDFVTWIVGGGLAASATIEFAKLKRKKVQRRDILNKLLKGIAKIAVGFPLGTYDKLAMFMLMYSKGEVSNSHPLKWHYLDLFVPNMVIGRDAIYARKLEEGIVPLASKGSSKRIKLDIHCGAGHTRMPRFIQNKELRDKVLQKYADDNFSEFDKTYLNKIFVFKYNPIQQKWDKQEHDVDLF